MSMEQISLEVKLVDSLATPICMLDTIIESSWNGPPLYVDFNRLYLVDIHELGETAFAARTDSRGEASLKNDPRIRQYTKDLQLMKLATRTGSKKYVAGLAECIEKDSPVSPERKMKWKQQMERAVGLFYLCKNGRFETLKERPLKDDAMRWCVQKVILLPKLYVIYNSRLDIEGRRKVQIKTKDRILLLQYKYYYGQESNNDLILWDENTHVDINLAQSQC
ncbi:hypothetical protein AJ79_01897 [Helicocarpus griseus UAMH5409]|uniref:Uncharacterized protein n=1 Tax=Helicocarpus griseus UAMH5409 TaxID=1447875 RepID=A0A2B7Y4H8_9EURO|nr:hypothetical protein AJ79_01897 [Helicocarpus griseus UAMH5409]